MFTKLKTNKIIYLIIAFAFIGALAWKFFRTPQASDYTEFIVSTQDISQTLELSGEIDAHLRADLHFSTGGLVTYFPWSEGDTIKKFSTIASLDSRSIKKQLSKQLNLYATTRNSFEDTQDAYEKQIDDGDIDKALRRILDNAQYNLNNSVIDVELQDLSLKLSRLYAPFTGILVASPITTPNVNISIADKFTLIDPTTLYFVADLDESDLSQVKLDLPVKLTLDAYPNLPIETKIEKISYASKVTSTGTTYEVTIPIPKDELSKLRLGLNGTASVVIAQKQNILTLPLEAIKQDSDKTYVSILENGKLVNKTITTGIADDFNIEVTSGLKLGDIVVVEKNND